MDHLESFIADCDRRTELAKKRLVETQDEISAEVAEKVRARLTLYTESLILTHFMLLLTCVVFCYSPGRDGSRAERGDWEAPGQGRAAGSRGECR